MSLTEAKIKAASLPKGKKQDKLSDGKGLFLLLHTNGSKYWRMNYRFHGKQKTLALGVYPDVSLKKARAECERKRQQIREGIDPAALKKAEKQAVGHTFEAIALEWFERNRSTWAASHAATVLARLESYVFPVLGSTPINVITSPSLLAMLRKIEAKGIIETAHRVRSICSQVFRYAVATGKAESDPTTSLKGALTPVAKKNFSTITEPAKVGELLRAIDGYEGTFTTLCALRIAPYIFVRPGELRKAEWREFDLEERQWHIPAEKMKMKRPHIVPLSNQVMAILNEVQSVTGEGLYVFPAVRTNSRPMSENTLNAALRRLGFEKSEICSHGFRGMASTILHEQGWLSDVVEMQLAHTPHNTVKAAYNRAQHLSERIKMMQAWADYLEGLKTSSNVVTLKRKA